MDHFSQQSTVYRNALIKPGLESQFRDALKQYFTDSEMDLIYSTWDILRATTSLYPIDLGLLKFISDVRFYMPIVRTMDTVEESSNLWIYHFHEVSLLSHSMHITINADCLLQPNPFDGSLRGLATHELDLPYVLQNYIELLPKESQSVANDMSKCFIEFANGNLRKWEVGKERAIKIWGAADCERGVKLMRQSEYDTQLRSGSSEVIARLGLQRCMLALDAFQYSET